MRFVGEIRDAVPFEADLLEVLQRRSSAIWESDRAFLEAHPEAIEPPQLALAESRVRVAVEPGGRLVGFCVVGPNNGSAVEIEELFVDADAMGVGVGRALVEDAASRALTMGAGSVTATINLNAVGFYERVGFAVSGSARTQGGDALRVIRDFRRERPLS